MHEKIIEITTAAVLDPRSCHPAATGRVRGQDAGCVQVTKAGIDASIGWQWRWRMAAAEGQQ